MKAFLLVSLRILVALGAAAVAVALGLAAAGKWDLGDQALLVILVVAAALSFLDSSLSAIGQYRAPRTAVRQHQAAQILWVALHDIARHAGIDPLELGIAAYQRQRRLRSLPPFADRLRSIYRERPRHRQGSAQVTWAPGKGVLGYAVADGDFNVLDVAAAWAPYQGCSELDWKRAPDDVRLGLSYEEFKRLDGMYGTVAAMPILDSDGKPRGCVVVDAPAGNDVALRGTDVATAFGDACVSLGRTVLRLKV